MVGAYAVLVAWGPDVRARAARVGALESACGLPRDRWRVAGGFLDEAEARECMDELGMRMHHLDAVALATTEVDVSGVAEMVEACRAARVPFGKKRSNIT